MSQCCCFSVPSNDVRLRTQVHTLAAGSETGHSPEQLEAVRGAVAKLNDVRLKVRIRCADATTHPAAHSFHIYNSANHLAGPSHTIMTLCVCSSDGAFLLPEFRQITLCLPGGIWPTAGTWR